MMILMMSMMMMMMMMSCFLHTPPQACILPLKVFRSSPAPEIVPELTRHGSTKLLREMHSCRESSDKVKKHWKLVKVAKRQRKSRKGAGSRKKSVQVSEGEGCLTESRVKREIREDSARAQRRRRGDAGGRQRAGTRGAGWAPSGAPAALPSSLHSLPPPPPPAALSPAPPHLTIFYLFIFCIFFSYFGPARPYWRPPPPPPAALPPAPPPSPPCISPLFVTCPTLPVASTSYTSRAYLQTEGHICKQGEEHMC
jgi:hypothetical protein